MSLQGGSVLVYAPSAPRLSSSEDIAYSVFFFTFFLSKAELSLLSQELQKYMGQCYMELVSRIILYHFDSLTLFSSLQVNSESYALGPNYRPEDPRHV